MWSVANPTWRERLGKGGFVPYKVQSFTSNSALTDVKSSKFESTHLNISTIDF